MGPDDVFDALATDPALAAPERGGRPVFVVDDAGEIVWAGPAARRLIAAGELEFSARQMLAGMAATGSEGLVRLRIGASGRLAPLIFRALPMAVHGAAALVALEGLTPLEAQAEEAEFARAPIDEEPGASEDEVAAASEAEDDAAAPARGIAAEEGAPPNLPGEAEAALEPIARPAEQPPGEETSAPAEDRPAEDLRFVFEIDGDGRVTLLSPDLARAVGASAEAAVGRPWSETADALGLDPADAVCAAIERRGAWGEIQISWPTADGRRLPIVLTALPMFDRGRTFVGFRGLGRATAAPLPAPVEAVPAEPEPTQPVAADSAAEDLSATVDSETGDRQDDAPEEPAVEEPASAPVPADRADQPPAAEEPPFFAAPPAAPPYGGNVVPLRDATLPLAALTTSEESAFDEIARRLRGLGARVTDPISFPTMAPSPTESPETAAIAPTPAGDGNWTLDDVDGRAPTASRVDDLLRLLDRLPVGALVLRAGVVAHANRAALDTLGHPDLASLRARGAEELFAAPPPRDDAAPSTLRVIASDGVEVEVEARLSTVLWDGGPATLVSLKRAEGAIAAAQSALAREREAAAILDIAADGVLTLDGAGRILSVNRGAERLFGFEGRDPIGGLFTLSLAPESRRVAFEYLDQVRADGGSSMGHDGREVLGLARQGGAVPLHLTIGRLGDAGDARFCAVLRDITPWKKAEEDLLAARRQAERANAQKSEFLAKISHEIRTPLNAIIGFAEVMMEERFGPVGSPRYKDYLRDIHVSGSHLVGLVNDLLDITRVESGGLKLDLSPVDLNEIAAQAVALLQPQANRDHVIIRTSLARGLPPVLADRRSVRQIMTNLASNAVRLSRPGGQVILATALTDVGQAVIRVRDAGFGMSKQELARALEPFRSLATADNDAGAALGLPLTRALAEANEASLALQSEIGLGTLAEVTFPSSRVLAG
ncbi:PAS domain-containing protein [Hansschlegelia zhihuaiae]|uniref:histidine kinase n=1 Tax=Hansschlegelia zhihuaiae TaxID=405005 RepID=A0A4Q0M4I7_9HYPH|nr:PAS domain-containing protein [Hansschlegelia zhihuaiae]RXF67546.1 PAS domain-containing protein [Hansschlegelia zhihuaiae]